MNPGNGCLQMLRGSHKMGRLDNVSEEVQNYPSLYLKYCAHSLKIMHDRQTHMTTMLFVVVVVVVVVVVWHPVGRAPYRPRADRPCAARRLRGGILRAGAWRCAVLSLQYGTHRTHPRITWRINIQWPSNSYWINGTQSAT